MTRGKALLWIVVLSLCGPSLPVLAQDDADAEYMEIVGEALQEFDAGAWVDARASFRHAHRLQPNARTFRGLGMVAYELREYVDAVRYLERAMLDARIR